MTDSPIQVEIKTDRPGYDQFIGSWVFSGPVRVICDVGPAATAESFLNSLLALGINKVDYVLLTHIHLDHAGALAAVLDQYPTARAVCHARAVEHLIDPGRLWSGSLKVLGELAQLYGRPAPVDRRRLIPHPEAKIEGLTVLETPGHAMHHLSFSWQGGLLAGEAAGNLLMVQGRQYLRPATPPRFFLEEALVSVDRLLALPDQPIYYAHFGQASGSREMLLRFKDQLPRWRDIMAAELEKEGRPADPGSEELTTRLIKALLIQDPELAAFEQMPPQQQQREKTFMANSVRGYLGYLKSRAA